WRRVRDAGYSLPPIVHPRSTVSESAKLGDGTTVMAGAVVNPGATVGIGCVLNTLCLVEHDDVIGDFTFIGPKAGLRGTVTLGSRALVGIGASIATSVVVGDDVIIGAGAVVIRPVPAATCVVGVPARPIGRRR